MRVTVLNAHETDLGALAERLYAGLTPATRRHAEAALLRANPQLTEAGAWQAGAVIAAPAVPGLAFSPAAGGREPVDEVRRVLFAALEGYRDHLSDRLKTSSGDLDRQRRLLENDQVARAVREADLGELLDGLYDALQRREQALAEAGNAQQALFAQLLQDVATPR